MTESEKKTNVTQKNSHRLLVTIKYDLWGNVKQEAVQKQPKSLRIPERSNKKFPLQRTKIYPKEKLMIRKLKLRIVGSQDKEGSEIGRIEERKADLKGYCKRNL